MTNSRRRALPMINRNARTANSALDGAVALLGGSSINIRDEAFPIADRLVEANRRNAAAIECVIIGGGGSLNAVAPALVGTGLPLGILTLGTANDLARTFEIAPEPIATARIIAAGAIRALFVGSSMARGGMSGLSSAPRSRSRPDAAGTSTPRAR
jgi:diacylglycerol kinase (ATP)